jgi:hypothetical protein
VPFFIEENFKTFHTKPLGHGRFYFFIEANLRFGGLTGIFCQNKRLISKTCLDRETPTTAVFNGYIHTLAYIGI